MSGYFVLRWVALAVGDVAIVDFLLTEWMQTVVANEGCMTIVFRSAGSQAGHVFDSHIVAGFVWSFNQEQVDVMEAVTFLADVQRNESALIAAAEYINAYGGVLFFKFGDV